MQPAESWLPFIEAEARNQLRQRRPDVRVVVDPGLNPGGGAVSSSNFASWRPAVWYWKTVAAPCRRCAKTSRSPRTDAAFPSAALCASVRTSRRACSPCRREKKTAHFFATLRRAARPSHSRKAGLQCGRLCLREASRSVCSRSPRVRRRAILPRRLLAYRSGRHLAAVRRLDTVASRAPSRMT